MEIELIIFYVYIAIVCIIFCLNYYLLF